MGAEINLMIAGEAGQGIKTLGHILAKAFARGGHHVFADRDYESRIQGGHSFCRVRVRDTEVNAVSDSLDIVVAMNQESIGLHKEQLKSGGLIVYDGNRVGEENGDHLFSVPLEQMARDKAGSKAMSNSVGLGAALGLLGYNLQLLEGVFRDHFSDEQAQPNIEAARSGYEYALRNSKGYASRLETTDIAKRMVLNGNEALGLGAIAAGCKLIAAYPMTPATSIMEYMASRGGELGIAVYQPEDEIAAINVAVGAGYAGVRAMTATSGSGLCLMVEGLGLAGLTETPVVIVDAQRPGPAVGLATRTGQGDLQFVLNAHHDDFPKAVLAPRSVEDAFWTAVRAFNLSEKYQLPVIVLTDAHLATSFATVGELDFSKISIERGEVYRGKAEEYQRHRITESGVSPRAFPGQSKALVVTNSCEHNEEGHRSEDAGTRTAMMQKRMRKLEALGKEVAAPQRYGSEKGEITLLAWGSTCGAVKEAVDVLENERAGVNCLLFNELYPFPAEPVRGYLRNAGKVYAVENNFSGHFARLIKDSAGIGVDGEVLKYDGRPFTPTFIAGEIGKEVR